MASLSALQSSTIDVGRDNSCCRRSNASNIFIDRATLGVWEASSGFHCHKKHKNAQRMKAPFRAFSCFSWRSFLRHQEAARRRWQPTDRHRGARCRPRNVFRTERYDSAGGGQAPLLSGPICPATRLQSMVLSFVAVDGSTSRHASARV